jgi:hypothetical protein
MGENTAITGRLSPADRIQQEIRYTERDIGNTIHSLEERLSPRNLRRQGIRKATRMAVHGTTNLLDYAKRKPVQVTLVGTGAVLLWMRRRKAHKARMRPSMAGLALATTLARAFFTGARGSAKKGTSVVGKRAAWRGLATAVGAALGTYWYNRKEGRV